MAQFLLGFSTAWLFVALYFFLQRRALQRSWLALQKKHKLEEEAFALLWKRLAQQNIQAGSQQGILPDDVMDMMQQYRASLDQQLAAAKVQVGLSQFSEESKNVQEG